MVADPGGQSGESSESERDPFGEPADAFGELYPELRAIAAAMFNGSGGTLQPTALVHEVFVKLHRAGRLSINDAEHFKALAARVMRQVMVDHARRRALARGAFTVMLDLRAAAEPEERAIDLLELDEAIRRLHDRDARAARVVDCRVFGGLTLEQTATALGLGRSTVAEDWRFARAWLAKELA